MSLLQTILSNNLVASIIGGLIAGGFAVWAVRDTLRNQRKLDKEHRCRTIKGTLEAIREELRVIGEFYNEELGTHWKNWEKFQEYEKQEFKLRISLSQDYSIVYSSNANSLGQIPNPALRHEIVEVYTSFKVLIDYYKMNDTLMSMDENERADWDVSGFTKRLRGHHYRFLNLNQKVLGTLEEELTKLSKNQS